MPGMPFSEIFTWRSKRESDNIILHHGGVTLKHEEFATDHDSLPYAPHIVINAQLARLDRWERKDDVACFFQKDMLFACATGFTAFFAMILNQCFFRFGPLQYVMCAPPVFLTPYYLSRYDQTRYVTCNVLLGKGNLCPLCYMYRGGFGMLVTSALTTISLSTLLAYGVTYAHGHGRKVPAPTNFNGLVRMGTKLLRKNRSCFLSIVVSNFTFGFWFAYVQVSAYYNIHKADIHNSERTEYEKQRKLE